MQSAAASSDERERLERIFATERGRASEVSGLVRRGSRAVIAAGPAMLGAEGLRVVMLVCAAQRIMRITSEHESALSKRMASLGLV
jgi:hypothetical protein